METKPVILIVDDEPFNISVLEQELEDLGYATISAGDGRQALTMVAAESPDLVLLDIMMPVLDGFGVLSQLKASPESRDIPVIVISALSDIGNIVKGIEQGAEDYLPKPFDSVLLAARVGACIEKKRLRDLELAYLNDVERLTEAAISVEGNAFDPASLDPVAVRSDSLGGLARVFQRMAEEVRAREQRLNQQLQQALMDKEEHAQSANDSPSAYIPMDRRIALSRNESLPKETRGACLFVDVSGFTGLSEALSAELGGRRGAEELIRALNAVFGALIEEVHYCRGSVVSFSGDALTCWFEGDSGRRAAASAIAMQRAMARFDDLTTPAGTIAKLAIKAAVAAGIARRYVIGNPEIQTFDVLSGQPVDDVALAERVAKKGQVVALRSLVERDGSGIAAAAWRTDLQTGQEFAIVSGVADTEPVEPWPLTPPDALPDRLARPWLLPAVYEEVTAGTSEFLSELRSAAALFLRFHGLDFEGDSHAGEKLDVFVRWVQGIVHRYGGSMLQLTVGDKGSYLYAVFGAPVVHDDDPLRSVAAALELRSPPRELQFITAIDIGLAYGEMRSGAYGSRAQRTFGVQGSPANLAAYLMQHAAGDILCDESICQLTRSKISFDTLPAIPGKKGGEPVPVFRPNVTSAQGAITSRLDQLPNSIQLTLKVASVIGERFAAALVQVVHPVETSRSSVEDDLARAEQRGFIVRIEDDPELAFAFADSLTRDQVYGLLLHAQRRGIHQAIAEWYEAEDAADTIDLNAVLAYHSAAAGDPSKSSFYYEQAGTQAMDRGEADAAGKYFRAALLADR